MKKRTIVIVAVYLIPFIVIAVLIGWHKSHQSGIRISRGDLHKTEVAWNSLTYVDVTTNKEFLATLVNSPAIEDYGGLDNPQKSALKEVIKKIILANYCGDYEIYSQFRKPAPNYETPDIKDGWAEWYKSLFPDRIVPQTFDAIDHQIWDRIFSGHPYWSKICADSIEVAFVETNQPAKTFGFDYPPIKTQAAFGGASDGSISYSNYLAAVRINHPKLIFARVGFMVKTIDPPDAPRPFCYILALDPANNIWIPVHIVYMSAKPYKNNPPF